MFAVGLLYVYTTSGLGLSQCARACQQEGTSAVRPGRVSVMQGCGLFLHNAKPIPGLTAEVPSCWQVLAHCQLFFLLVKQPTCFVQAQFVLC